MPLISKKDSGCANTSIVALLFANQECLVTFQRLTSQVEQRERPLVAGPGKTKENGQERNLERQSQKEIGLCACTKLKYSTFLCLILMKSICQDINCSFRKTKVNLESWQLKDWLNGLNSIFWVIAWCWKGSWKWFPPTKLVLIFLWKTPAETGICEVISKLLLSGFYYSTNCNTIQIWSWCSRYLSSVGNRYPAVYVASYVLNVTTVPFEIKFTRPFLLQGLKLFCYHFVE